MRRRDTAAGAAFGRRQAPRSPMASVPSDQAKRTNSCRAFRIWPSDYIDGKDTDDDGSLQMRPGRSRDAFGQLLDLDGQRLLRLVHLGRPVGRRLGSCQGGQGCGIVGPNPCRGGPARHGQRQIRAGRHSRSRCSGSPSRFAFPVTAACCAQRRCTNGTALARLMPRFPEFQPSCRKPRRTSRRRRCDAPPPIVP